MRASAGRHSLRRSTLVRRSSAARDSSARWAALSSTSPQPLIARPRWRLTKTDSRAHQNKTRWATAF
eukprot:scaffold201_cov121-Isochrysis_galbana.AAC.5